MSKKGDGDMKIMIELPKERNPMARALSQGQYQPKKIVSKKAYNRKRRSRDDAND